MSPAERFRRNPVLARVLVERLRAGTTLTATAPGADAREVEEAAADMLEAGLAEPEPGACCRALELLRGDAASHEKIGDDAGGAYAAGVRRALEALGPFLAEPVADAPCPVDRCVGTWGHRGSCPVLQGPEPAPVAGVSAEERARCVRIATVWADGGLLTGDDLHFVGRTVLRLGAALDAADARAAQAERERDEARATVRAVWGLARAAAQFCLEGASKIRLGAALLPPRMPQDLLIRLREQETPDAG